MKEPKLLQRIGHIELLSILAIVFFIAFPFAAQAVSCGDTITTDTTLTSDLGPCSSSGIIIGADNITLDCKGHTISCDGDDCFSMNSRGIFLDSRTGVTIKKCKVSKFLTGFFLESSSKNKLLGNSAVFNSFGFILNGSSNNNTLRGNTAINNTVDGFFLSNSFKNTLKGNTAIGHQDNGFDITNGSSNNTLKKNTAINSITGFTLGNSSSNNTLNGNTALNNTLNGFVLNLFATNNTLTRNTACFNGRFNVIQDSSSTGNVFTPNNKFCPPNSL